MNSYFNTFSLAVNGDLSEIAIVLQQLVPDFENEVNKREVIASLVASSNTARKLATEILEILDENYDSTESSQEAVSPSNDE